MILWRRKGRTIAVIVEGPDEDLQRQAIEEWAQANKKKIDHWIKVKPGEEVEAGKGDQVLVYNLRKLAGGDPKRAYQIYQKLKKQGAEPIQVQPPAQKQPQTGC